MTNEQKLRRKYNRAWSLLKSATPLEEWTQFEAFNEEIFDILENPESSIKAKKHAKQQLRSILQLMGLIKLYKKEISQS